ncbi:dienelactone hydrolase family protein [Lujinxingia vulgaris]|uniref:Dienelactone hydrolase family protein n=1 Tax=Lujinxingia vulgaris TaxID=2600176 RepID=A0A5C6XPE3_9DELT|nr:dienelactone hydrolase family protein [Lujinxingia vulgaris]TXD39482.1 dienelactone hydrolase family protein [Lujinxingia vulgaris]
MNRRLMVLLITSFALASTLACSSSSSTPDEAPSESQTSEASDAESTEYSEAMAHEHHDDAPTPSDPNRPQHVEGVEAINVAYHQGLNGAVEGYLATPEDLEPISGVVIVHEWWGLNDNIRAMAEQLAAEGYAVLAVDLYDGSSAQTPDEAKALMESASANSDALVANMTSAVNFLRDELNVTSIATLGWCFGGGQAFNAAAALGDQVDAAVVYYGWVPTEASMVAPVEAPVLGIFAEEDGGIPMELVRGFESAMDEADRELELHIFPGVDHAFANPSGNNYDAESAQKAWELTMAFLDEHLAN